MGLKRVSGDPAKAVDLVLDKTLAKETRAVRRASLVFVGVIKEMLSQPGRGAIRRGGRNRVGLGSFRRGKDGKLHMVQRGAARVNIDVTDRASLPGDPPAPDTAHLRNSIAYELTSETTSEVGTNVEYACVLGSHVNVPVLGRPAATISQVRAADSVLTATGEWRSVDSTFRFPVGEKPDLVTIRYPWRAGSFHELTVTQDHKIAIEREGRVLWLPAGEIRNDDRVFTRRKLAHNTKAWKCANPECDAVAPKSHGHKRLCWRCAKRAIAEWHQGRTRSVESRQRMSIAAQGRPVNHLAAIARHSGGSLVERNVAAWLDERGTRYERNAVFGRCYVDFWLPENVEIVEADGAYWHRNQRRDIERDRALTEMIPGVRITHLHFYDPRWTPILDPNPLPNVRYEVVNPSAKSFVEPDCFSSVLVETRQWRWNTQRRSKEKWPSLYDISVDAVHSYVAAGLLISNSYLEFGTTRIAPRPFMRPSFVKAAPLMGPVIAEELGHGE